MYTFYVGHSGERLVLCKFRKDGVMFKRFLNIVCWVRKELKFHVSHTEQCSILYWGNYVCCVSENVLVIIIPNV